MVWRAFVIYLAQYRDLRELGNHSTNYVGDVHEALLLARLLPDSGGNEPLRFVDFAAPIRNKQGQVIGVVAVHAHWSWVTETVQRVANRRDGDNGLEILIVSKTGEVLYPQAMVGVSHLPESAHRNKHYEIITWGDSRRYLTSQVLVDAGLATNLGWRIVVRQPLEKALVSVYATYWRFLILAFIAMILFSLLAWRLAQSVSKPIEQLAAAALNIRQPATALRYPTGTKLREVAQLSNAMQSMTESLLTRENMNALQTERIRSLEVQVSQLHALVGSGISQSSDLHSLLKVLIRTTSKDSQIDKAVSVLIESIAQGAYSENDKAVNEAIETIATKDPNLLKHIRDIAKGAIGGATGDLASSWILALINALPK